MAQNSPLQSAGYAESLAPRKVMSKKIIPARIHVLISKDQKKALVLRRGPSKEVCVLSWDLQNNKIEVSQWLKGRIYERRCDICPDGKYWVYFAMNGHWNTEAKGAWTAIAKYPWLKTISLYAKGDCWNGGGLFLSNRSFWLNNGYGHEALHTSKDVTLDSTYTPANSYGGECLTVYYNRLQRDGWVLVSRESIEKWNSITTFDKSLSNGWILKKIAHEQVGSPEGKGCYWDEHKVINPNGIEEVHEDWEWADTINDRLYFAQNGAIYGIDIEQLDSGVKPELVHDFNGYVFESKEAPY